MKRIASLVVALATAAGLAACGPSADTKAKDKKAVSKSAAKPAPAAGADKDSAAAPAVSRPADNKVHRVVGVVKEIDRAEGTFTLDHDPVASLNWPAKTQTFAARGALITQLQPGAKVEFDFVQKNGDNVATELK